MPVTTISTDAPVATLVNTFVVDPAHQQELIDLLVTATEDVMRGLPGFLTANLLASKDGTRVVNYAQWDSDEALMAMLAHPAAQEHLGKCAAVSESFDPHLYTVSTVLHR